MACRERGMALVNVVLLLTMLLTLAHTLADKVWQSSRVATAAAGRDRAFWAAQAGIEWARHRLAGDYRDSGGWQDRLIGGAADRYPGTPAWTTESNGLPVEIFLRDNADGDDDPARDNDLKIYVLARARSPLGDETLVEALCGLDPTGAAWNTNRSGRTGESTTGAIDPDQLPVSTYTVKP